MSLIYEPPPTSEPDPRRAILDFARGAAAELGLKAGLEWWGSVRARPALRIHPQHGCDAWHVIAQEQFDAYTSDLGARAKVNRELRAWLEGFLQLKDVDCPNIRALARLAAQKAGFASHHVDVFQTREDIAQGIWRLQLVAPDGGVLVAELRIREEETLNEIRDNMAWLMERKSKEV